MFTQFVNYIQKNIGTSAVTLVTVPASNQLAVNQLSCANVTSLSVTCSVTVTRAGVTIFILRSATVPPGGSLICVGESQKIVLMAGDVLQVQSSTATSIDCVVSGVLNDFNRAVTVPAPPASPVATFSITPSTTSTIEGGTVTYNITTTNVPNGTVLYWQNFGTATALDFTDDRNDGEFVITSGAGSFTRTLRTTGQGGDPGGEGAKTIDIGLQFRPGYLGGGVVAGAATVTLQPDTIVTSGLVLNLDAGNIASYPGSGTVWNDLSGGSRNFTLINGVGYTTANGGALTFDGTDDRAESATVILPTANASPFTLEAFCQPNTTAPGYQTVLGTAGSFSQIGFSTTNFAAGRNGGGGNTLYTSLASITANTWYHLAMTYNGTTAVFYLNGNQVFTGSIGTNGSSNGVSLLGTYAAGASSERFSGRLAVARIYNVALSATEVAQNFSSARGRYGL